jgi:hypothetical protein
VDYQQTLRARTRKRLAYSYCALQIFCDQPIDDSLLTRRERFSL